MIPPSIIAEAKRLLAEGQTQREVARLLGISRGTIGAVLKGRRPNYADREDESRIDPNALKSRCGGCGALCVQPCLACRDRELLKKAVGRRPEAVDSSRLPTTDALDFELRPDHRARLDEVRLRRLEAGDCRPEEKNLPPQASCLLPPASGLPPTKKVPADRAA